MSNSSTSKKKELPLNEIFFHLCYDLLRFIDRKIIKKYIFPNCAQLPKERRSPEQGDDQKVQWTYFFKDEELTEEEKIKDVFKDDKFLGYLQNLTNSLIIVVEYLDQNQKKIKRFEQDVKNAEEKLSALNDLKVLLNKYFGNAEAYTADIDRKINNNILEDQKLVDIMTKIKNFNMDAIIDDNDKKNAQNILDSNLLDNLKNIINNNENKRNNLINNITPIKESIKDKEKNIIKNINDKNIKKQNNDNNKNIENFLFNKCLENLNKNKISNNNNFNSDKKVEVKTFMDNSKFNPGVLRSPKFEKRESENLPIFDLNNKKEDISKDKKLLNKKFERENIFTKDDNIPKIGNKEEKNRIMLNKKNLTSEKKIPKNKRKNKNFFFTDKKDNQHQISLKEESIKYPIIKQKKEETKKLDEESSEKIEKKGKNKMFINWKKNEEDIDDDIINSLLESYDDKNNIKNDNKLEAEFDSELVKEFCEVKAINYRAKNIKDIIASIGAKSIKNYNQRINGPFLVGSYKTISDLPTINYNSPIDILYSYKDMLLNKIIIDFTLNSIFQTCLNLNILEKTGFREDANKITKISVKCGSKQNINVIISFNILFMDIGYNLNEQILNEILLNKERPKFEKKEDEKKFTTIILYLRTWRRKNKLFFILPEILDEFAKKYYGSNKTLGIVIFNVFYDFYNSNSVLPNHKPLYEKLLKIWFESSSNKEKIHKAVLAMHKMVNDRNFQLLFKIEEENE